MTPGQAPSFKNLAVHPIEWGSADYVALVALREALFRQPFGLIYSEEELLLEKPDRHIAAFVDLKPIGFVSLREIAEAEGQIQLRQMVVSPKVQRRGVGRRLVTAAEKSASEANFRTVILDSRKESIEFYKALGYSPVGELFFFKTVMHQKMHKNIVGSSMVPSV